MHIELFLAHVSGLGAESCAQSGPQDPLANLRGSAGKGSLVLVKYTYKDHSHSQIETWKAGSSKCSFFVRSCRLFLEEKGAKQCSD